MASMAAKMEGMPSSVSSARNGGTGGSKLGASNTGAPAPGPSPSLPPSMGKRQSMRRGSNGTGVPQKQSMQQRCKNLEENMMRNLDTMREHRLHTDRIKELRKEQAEKNAQEMRQGTATDFAAMLREDRGEPRKIGEGSMKTRCQTLDEQLQDGKSTLDDHRLFLDEVHAVKRGRAEARGEVYDPTGGRAVTESDLKCRQVQENARWMGPALQAAAHAKAVQMETPRSPASHRTPRSEASGPSKGTWAPPAAPNSARSPQAAAGPPLGSSQNAGSRPTSARPTSAGSSACAHFDSRGNNRPGSAGASMKARFRALEDAAKRNRDQIQTNRKDIEIVVKVRQEKAQKLVSDLLEDMRTAFKNQGEAEDGE